MKYCILLLLLTPALHAETTPRARAALALASADRPEAPSGTPCGKANCDCGCADGDVCRCAAKKEGWLWTDEDGGYYYKWVEKAVLIPQSFYSPPVNRQSYPKTQPYPSYEQESFRSYGNVPTSGGFRSGGRGGC